jgi:hypothetical protein
MLKVELLRQLLVREELEGLYQYYWLQDRLQEHTQQIQQLTGLEFICTLVVVEEVLGQYTVGVEELEELAALDSITLLSHNLMHNLIQ